jgi:predicted CopG family antitoxin
MAEGRQVRVQQDVYEEVEEMPGASFSEKLRAWKNRETQRIIENLEGSDTLSQSDVREACREAIQEARQR